MLDLTVLIITKNEENNITKCIESFRGIAKRFVIVDSFSDDNTEEICIKLAKKYNIDFYKNKFIDHATQINWGLNNTEITTEWVMRIDADEELTNDLVQELIVRLPNINSNVAGIILNRRIYFMGKWIKYGSMYPMKILRLFRNGKAFCEQKMMDEHIVLSEGELLDLNKDFIDNNTKNLDWWINKHNWYSNKEVLDYLNNLKKVKDDTELSASLFKGQAERKRWIKNYIYYKTPLLKRAKWYFFYRYFIKFGFLDGKEGLIFHFLQGYWYRFLVDSKIYEYNKSKNKY